MALKAQARPRGLFGSYLITSLLAVFLCVILVSAPAATAKNIYELYHSSEGDPGDGVLRPIPRIVDPEPVPYSHFSPLINNVLLFGGSRYDRPFLLLPILFYGEIYPSAPDRGRRFDNRSRILLPDGRWQNAP